MKTFNFEPSTQTQISSLIMDNLNPIKIHISEDIEIQKHNLRSFIKLKDLIFELGESEHSNDWDPSIKITFNNERESIETEPGYNVIEIDNDDLLIENELGMGDYDDEDQSYFRIPISSIETIQLINN